MKKSIIILIVVLVGIFFVNVLSNTSKTQEVTIDSVVKIANSLIDSMTQDEFNKLAEKMTTEELDDALILMKQWRALLTITIEANKIISER